MLYRTYLIHPLAAIPVFSYSQFRLRERLEKARDLLGRLISVWAEKGLGSMKDLECG